MTTSFTERHGRRGLVSNQDRNRDDWGHKPPFVSVICCGREECIDKAIRYVASATNQTAHYQPDEGAL